MFSVSESRNNEGDKRTNGDALSKSRHEDFNAEAAKELALMMRRGDTQPSKYVEYFQIQTQLYKLPLQQVVHS